MDAATHILALPSEIRLLILRHLFSESEIYYQRSPSRRRLRSSLVDKNDVKGILQASRLFRSEAIPIFFQKHAFLFHSFDDLLEFMIDVRVDVAIKNNITRVAVDIGDVTDFQSMRATHIKTMSTAFDAFPRLQSLEVRIYARTDNMLLENNFDSLSNLWDLMNKAHSAAVIGDAMANTDYLSFITSGDSFAKSLHTMTAHGINIKIQDTRARYWMEHKNLPNNVDLKVCKLVLSKTADAQLILGGAHEAVEQRMKVAGAIHIRDTSLLDCDAWRDNWQDWCWRNQDIVGERYH